MSVLDDAWQAALAAEHQALFGYGVLGPRLASADRQLAYDCVDAHETLRDDTLDAITAAGLRPVAPQPDYPALYPVRDAPAARRLAARLEEACAQAWRYLYLQAASTSAARGRTLRAAAQHGLTASAVRSTRWRALVAPGEAAVAFPGT